MRVFHFFLIVILTYLHWIQALAFDQGWIDHSQNLIIHNFIIA